MVFFCPAHCLVGVDLFRNWAVSKSDLGRRGVAVVSRRKRCAGRLRHRRNLSEITACSAYRSRSLGVVAWRISCVCRFGLILTPEERSLVSSWESKARIHQKTKGEDNKTNNPITGTRSGSALVRHDFPRIAGDTT